MGTKWKRRSGFKFRKDRDGTTAEYDPKIKTSKGVRKLAKLKYIGADDIPDVARIRPSQGKALLDEFVESKQEAAILELEKDDKARSLKWSIARAIKASKAKVTVAARGGKVYLQRVHSAKK